MRETALFAMSEIAFVVRLTPLCTFEEWAKPAL
jgi:hypothetical protein